VPRRHTLRSMLMEHVPADPLERQYRQRMLDLCAGPEDPMSRRHFEPGHFTASGFVLSPEGDALLLIHHRKLDRGLQPGGHVEPGDPDRSHAGRREVAEEVGLCGLAQGAGGVFDLDIHSIPPLGIEPAHDHYDVRFLFQASDRAFETGDEVRAGRWFSLASLTHEDADASVMRVVHKLRAS